MCNVLVLIYHVSYILFLPVGNLCAIPMAHVLKDENDNIFFRTVLQRNEWCILSIQRSEKILLLLTLVLFSLFIVCVLYSYYF